MEVRTYRANSLREALRKVRDDLGPDAAVLHTREAPLGRVLGWLPGVRRFEVAASADVVVPSRLPARAAVEYSSSVVPNSHLQQEVSSQLAELQTMVEGLCRRTRVADEDMHESLFALYTDLIEAEMSDQMARELVSRTRAETPITELEDVAALRERAASIIERDIITAPPIACGTHHPRVVALVGPTGVGKTTTIAKLAANFRLREKRNVGLITVDTYRIAAVEQLRTYADIIDLPMEVVSAPREMREAVERMAQLDLILIDTAGRSPKDEVKIRELRALLCEARADEIHLVLSSVTSAAALMSTAERFAPAGATALVLTKLDEATALGNLPPLLRASRLPLSYVTNGQNVPDDIEPANARRLARLALGMEGCLR